MIKVAKALKLFSFLSNIEKNAQNHLIYQLFKLLWKSWLVAVFLHWFEDGTRNENTIWDLATFSLASENKHSSSPKYGIREEMHLEIFCRAS